MVSDRFPPTQKIRSDHIRNKKVQVYLMLLPGRLAGPKEQTQGSCAPRLIRGGFIELRLGERMRQQGAGTVPKHDQKLSPLGRYLGELPMSERWVASAARNMDLGFRHHSFAQNFLSVGKIGRRRAKGVSQLIQGRSEVTAEQGPWSVLPLEIMLRATLMPVVCVATKSHADVHGLCWCLKLC